MNTNTTLPTMSVMPDDHSGHRQWLTLDWMNGANRSQSLAVKLDWAAHEGGQDSLMTNLEGLFQHIWLMGYEAGVDGARVAEEDGYSHGAHLDFPNSYAVTDPRHAAFERGRNRRQLDNQSGARIEGLIGQNTSEREVIADLRRQLEHINGLHANQARIINTLTSERDEAIEQRDAMAEGLDHIQRSMMTATVPSVDPFGDHGVVTIYRANSNFNVQHWVPESGEGWESGVLAAELRGVIADAHQAGRNERDAEVNRLVAERDDALAIIRDYDHDWDVVRDHLLEEAENRSWCSEYDSYARGVNELTRRFDLIIRTHTYEVTVTVTQDLDYEPVDNAARDAGFPISHDVSNTTMEGVDYFFTLEDVLTGEIEQRAEALRRAVYNVSGVSSATVSYEEAD